MYLSRFGVKNYKCLGEIDIPLTPIHVVIGENDAGKTSLLEAMAALCASCERPLSAVFPTPWEGRELVFHGSPEPVVEFWGEWTLGDGDGSAPVQQPLRYGFPVRFPQSGTNCTTDAEWIDQLGTRRAIAPHSGPHPHTWPMRYRSGEGIPKQIDTRPFEVVSSVLKPAHKYALDPKIMAIPAAIDPGRKFRLDPDGFGLPRLLLDILGYDPELFIALRTEFCRYFTQFRSVRVESENAIRRHYDSRGAVTSSDSAAGGAIYFESQRGRTIRAQQASDGAILFLGFLAIAHLPDPPNLLLIEEPENGVYPKRLEEVIAMLRDMVSRKQGRTFPQVVLSTHSPYVLSFFQPEEVTFLSRPKDQPDGPVRARPLREAKKIQEGMGSEFYLGELWYNLTEEELFGD
jgi:energy-coupling factor transporter ATP-binding protein EcfA2